MSRLTKEREADGRALLAQFGTEGAIGADRLDEAFDEIDALRAERDGKKANCDGRCCEYHLPVEQERQRLAALCLKVQEDNRALRAELAEAQRELTEKRSDCAQFADENAAMLEDIAAVVAERDAALARVAELEAATRCPICKLDRPPTCGAQHCLAAEYFFKKELG